MHYLIMKKKNLEIQIDKLIIFIQNEVQIIKFIDSIPIYIEVKSILLAPQFLLEMDIEKLNKNRMIHKIIMAK